MEVSRIFLQHQIQFTLERNSNVIQWFGKVHFLFFGVGRSNLIRSVSHTHLHFSLLSLQIMSTGEKLSRSKLSESGDSSEEDDSSDDDVVVVVVSIYSEE